MGKTKAEAAEFLGVGTRAVDRFVERGLLSVSYIAGRSKPVALFNEKELHALLSENLGNGETDRIAEREAAPPSGRPAPRQTPQNMGLHSAEVAEVKNFLVEVMREAQSHEEINHKILFSLADFVEALHQKTTISDLAAKPLLTKREVWTYTGLSQRLLNEAIKSGKLKASLVGKSYLIKRADLDKFIETLF